MDDEEFLLTLREGLLGEDPEPEIELGVAANVLGTVAGMGDVRVLQLAQDDDFLHEGQSLVQYQHVFVQPLTGLLTTKLMERWVPTVYVKPTRQMSAKELKTPKEVVLLPPVEVRTAMLNMKPFDLRHGNSIEGLTELQQANLKALVDAPTLAKQERLRNMKKATQVNSDRKRQKVEHMRSSTKVLALDRVKQYPHESFEVAPESKYSLRCRACKMSITNIKSTICKHISSPKHVQKLKEYQDQMNEDEEIKSFVHDYFKLHPDEKNASLPLEVQMMRYRLVETSWQLGFP